jgi:predicted MPP superfamily phosphohydrolase
VAAHAIFAGGAGALERLQAAAALSYAAGLSAAVYGVAVRRRWVRVRTIDVSIAGLGPRFDGYRIAQLSDLHIGGLCPRGRAERWVRRVNALDADLVALTGDYVTSGTAFHEDIAAVLCALRARDGAMAVMGNHEYFGDGEPLVSLLRAGGVEVLRNERRTLSRGEDHLVIAGVDDTWSRRADVARTLDGVAARPVVALAHDPRLFPELARHGAALVLSGHTHWGQVAIPFVARRLNLSRLSYRYHAGLYRSGEATLYVNPGLGTTGPPVRLGAPPEITVLRLRSA